jgi:hypothetical protein
MKLIDLSGHTHILSLSKYMKPGQSERSCSKYHERTRELLREEFQGRIILEEVSAPGEQLYLDFFLPSGKIAIEVHGEQHYSFNKFFYKDQRAFRLAQMRDRRKREWCDLNEITLVELPYNESVDQWRKRLRECFRTNNEDVEN